MRATRIEELAFDRLDAADAALLSRLCPSVVHSGDSVRPPWRIAERRTFNHLWVLIGSGEGVFRVDGRRFAVRSDDFVWIPPDTLHEMEGTSPQMRCLFAHVDLLYDRERTRLFRVPGGVRDISGWSDFLPPPVGDPRVDGLCGPVRLSNPPRMKDLFTELCRTHRQEPERKLKQAGLLLEIIGEILDSVRPVGHADRGLSRAVCAIRERRSGNLDVAEVARCAAVSPSHLRRLFRRAYGMGPLAFHGRLRIEEACRLLRHGGLNVSETADALGFSNGQNFSRAFRKVMKETPRSFARRTTDTGLPIPTSREERRGLPHSP